MEPNLEGVKALAFDVFGTVVDYRTTIVAEGQRLGEAGGIEIDWAAFADAWRGRYRPSMDRVMRGELPWTNLDALHRAALEELLAEFGVSGLSEEEKQRLNGVWHRLRPWGDSVPGLLRLKTRFVLATLSNGNVRLLVDMAKNAGLPWDLIFSAELARAYKPDPRAYRMLQELLMLNPNEIMMVAAHQDDLRAAQDLGFKAAFVMRPLEHGPQAVPDLTADPSFDVVATDLVDLARQLGL
ncbi:haloacid dehalogenase type II [Rubrobacter tropicus]|uniref:Haloacid dehalogenase type II n=1 Tax=Rubrobacter tropicus TaxID=2653851 RepID=A0A6G8Q616_9ACTN|nr:haloacid dehalogenase type II [Rubrobacter tropicus]QIN81893.1 haloacid dehalogenase type II [Rubrobacter tropicus]